MYCYQLFFPFTQSLKLVNGLNLTRVISSFQMFPRVAGLRYIRGGEVMVWNLPKLPIWTVVFLDTAFIIHIFYIIIEIWHVLYSRRGG